MIDGRTGSGEPATEAVSTARTEEGGKGTLGHLDPWTFDPREMAWSSPSDNDGHCQSWTAARQGWNANGVNPGKIWFFVERQ
jgi:hypothetical protein